MALEGSLYRLAAEHRRALLAREREAASRMVRAYGESWQRIRGELDWVTQRIEEARAAGEDVRASWLFRQARYQTLQQQVFGEVAQFAGLVEGSVRGQQAEVVAAAQAHAEALMRAAVGEPVSLEAQLAIRWSHLPVGATEDLVGFLADGTPLSRLLETFAPQANAGVRRALVVGVATGQNPRQIARQLKREYGLPLRRALLISRTEVLRSYRESSLRSFRENSHIIRAWRWVAAHSVRTCAACLAMDGSEHTLDERLDDHPAGRCAAVPVTRTRRELGVEGVPDVERRRETGEEWLVQQPAAVQERVLGKAALAAYRDGAVTLKDFVGRKRSEEWGTTRSVRSLRSILGVDEALRWRRVARGSS